MVIFQGAFGIDSLFVRAPCGPEYGGPVESDPPYPCDVRRTDPAERDDPPFAAP